MQKRRDAVTILAEVLRAVREASEGPLLEPAVSRMAARAYLPLNRFKRYVSWGTEFGFLDSEMRVTPKGQKFLVVVAELESLLGWRVP